MRRLALVVVLAVAAAACGGDDDEIDRAAPAPTTTTTTTTSVVLDDEVTWLCHPDVDDACERDLDATIVAADGTTTPEPFELAADPPIDCFYVYPTVSNDPGDNSDLDIGPDEERVVLAQAARLGEVCAVYAPMYRQATLTALRRTLGGAGNRFFTAYGLAYADLLDAWRHYLDEDNDGRGVILLGHSQGAAHLLKLVQEEIDPNPTSRALLVSAMLIGTNAHASDLPNIPPCTSGEHTGCVISYSSFRADAPPSPGSFFARPKGSEAAICTNPATLAGTGEAAGALHPYFAGAAVGVPVDTPFAALPGLVSAECRDTDGFLHLAVTVHPGSGPRVDDVGGDLGPEWGLHLIDVNVAMGDLVAIARRQAEAYSTG